MGQTIENNCINLWFTCEHFWSPFRNVLSNSVLVTCPEQSNKNNLMKVFAGWNSRLSGVSGDNVRATSISALVLKVSLYRGPLPLVLWYGSLAQWQIQYWNVIKRNLTTPIATQYAFPARRVNRSLQIYRQYSN